jgi:hypothetical protein
MFRIGSARFVWFGRFVNEPSIFAVSRSKIVKDLPKPIERLIVPGPSMIPTPAFPIASDRRRILGGVHSDVAVKLVRSHRLSGAKEGAGTRPVIARALAFG